MGQQLIADIVSAAFAVVAVWTFLDAAELRGKDKESVSYNLLWGTGALALMLTACAVLAINSGWDCKAGAPASHFGKRRSFYWGVSATRRFSRPMAQRKQIRWAAKVRPQETG